MVAELKAVSGQESESIEVTVDSPNQVEAAVSNLASGSSQVVVEESETSSIAELDLSEDLTALGDRANNDTDLPETNDVNVAVEVRPEQFSNEDLASSQPALKKFINVTPEVTDDNQKTQIKHAECTPDFFVFDASLACVYRGQLDDSRPGNNINVTGSDLRAALDAVVAGNEVPEEQKPSMGCNIKWKNS